MSKHKPKTDPNAMIAAALDIEESDFDANDDGEIGTNQRRHLQKKRRNWLIWGAISLTLLIFSTVVVNSPTGLAFTLLSFAWFALIGPKAIAAWRDLNANRVNVVEGRVNQEVKDEIYGTTYKINVGDHTFEVDKRTFLAFKNGDPYRVYYAPRSEMLLGAAWLAGGDPFFDAPAADENDTLDELAHIEDEQRQNRYG